jgi:hypothetical protein
MDCLTLHYFKTTNLRKFKSFSIRSRNPNSLIVRAGSTVYMFGGTTHRVIERLVDPGEYLVAVLVVCADWDIPVDSAKC